MKDKAAIEAKLAEIESDERLGYPVATVRNNAPLALHQVHQKAEAGILRWVLDLPPGTYHEGKGGL